MGSRGRRYDGGNQGRRYDEGMKKSGCREVWDEGGEGLQSGIGAGSSESQEFRIGGGKGSQEKVIRSRRWERLFRMLMSGV